MLILVKFGDELAGQGGVFSHAVLIGCELAVHPDAVYAQGIGVQAGGAQGQIEDAFFGAPSYGFGVEQEQVGGVALAQKASVFQAQNFGRLSGELVHSLGHAHGAHFSGPVAQQMQTKTCIVEKCEVGTRVT